MDLFLSFLTIGVVPNENTLGHCNGWREFRNDEHELIIKGGIVNGYGLLLDRIQYKKNLDNKWNNYVNPFYLFEIMTDEGKKFFIDYYVEDIIEIKNETIARIDRYKKSIKHEREKLNALSDLIN